MAKRRAGNNVSFIDMLFNVLLGFVVLFIIAFLLINPITKRQDIPAKAEFMIMMEWDDSLKSDIDLWVAREGQKPVGFNNKSGDGYNLERDDLGQANDLVVIDGRTEVVYNNREVVNIRGVLPGTWHVNVHAYGLRDYDENGNPMPVKVKVTVADINPTYREAYTFTITLVFNNEVGQVPSFTIDEEGNIVEVFESRVSIVPNRGSTGR